MAGTEWDISAVVEDDILNVDMLCFYWLLQGLRQHLIRPSRGEASTWSSQKKTLYVCLLSVVCRGRSLRSGSSADPALLNLPEFTLNNLNLPKFT